MPFDGHRVWVSASFYYTYVCGPIGRFQAVALSVLLDKTQRRGYDAPSQAT